jgi:hypothetical protein
LKHIVTDLEAPNEPSSNEFPVLGNYSCDLDFGNFSPCSSEVLFSQKSKLSLHEDPELIEPCNKPEQSFHAQSQQNEGQILKIDWDKRVPNFISKIWTLFFYGSKSQEGVGAGCIFINPAGKHSFLSCRLEFECTNNTVEYEALVQGLKKDIDLGIKELIFSVIQKSLSDR